MQTIPEAIAKTLREEGVSGLYSGLGSSLFGIAVTNGIYYAFCKSGLSIIGVERRSRPDMLPSFERRGNSKSSHQATDGHPFNPFDAFDRRRHRSWTPRWISHYSSHKPYMDSSSIPSNSINSRLPDIHNQSIRLDPLSSPHHRHR